MKRNLVVSCLLLLIIVGVILATALRGESNVEEMLIELKAEVAAENWTQAHKSLEAVRGAWGRSRPYTSFTNSTQDIEAFDRGLAQTEAHIAARSKADAAAQVARLNEIWREFQD